MKSVARRAFLALAVGAMVVGSNNRAKAYDVDAVCTLTGVTVSDNNNYFALRCQETLSTDSNLAGNYGKRPWLSIGTSARDIAKFRALHAIAMAALLSGRTVKVSASVGADAGGEQRLLIKNLELK